jgi:predicted outer membrane protein
MILRGTAALLLVLVQPVNASAGERTAGLLHRVSCTVVRYYVGKYSEAAAEAWARGKGATDADIEAARHCLGNGSTQSVQAAAWH